jgi:hypothetical protein
MIGQPELSCFLHRFGPISGLLNQKAMNGDSIEIMRTGLVIIGPTGVIAGTSGDDMYFGPGCKMLSDGPGQIFGTAIYFFTVTLDDDGNLW